MLWWLRYSIAAALYPDQSLFGFSVCKTVFLIFIYLFVCVCVWSELGIQGQGLGELSNSWKKKKERNLFPQINTPSKVSLKRKILDLTGIPQLSLKTIFFFPHYDFKVNFIVIGLIFIKTL